MSEITKGRFPATYAGKQLGTLCAGFGNGVVLPSRDGAPELHVIALDKNFEYPHARFADFGVTGADTLRQIATPNGYSQKRTYVIPFANFPERMREPLLILAEMDTRIRNVEQLHGITKTNVLSADFDGKNFIFSNPVGGISRKTIVAALGIDESLANTVVFGNDFTRTVEASIVRKALGFSEPVAPGPANLQVHGLRVTSSADVLKAPPPRDAVGNFRNGAFQIGQIPPPR